MTFTYRTVRAAPDGVGALATLLGVAPTFYALFRAEVGMWNDEAILMVAGELRPVADGVVHELTMHAVARGDPADRPEEPGLYVHRWFHVRSPDVEEFVALSVGAWPSFERTFDGARIQGLWRATERDDDVRFLLLTRYTDLGQWEESRFYGPRTRPGAEEAFERFRRRREITQRTIARFTRLVTPG